MKVVALDQLSGIGLADGVKQPLGVGRAAQKVQRLQHALVLVLGQQDHGAGILARNMKSRATVAHLVHVLCQVLSKGAVGNVPH